MIKLLLLTILTAVYFQTTAQDTITVMHYNLLNYGNYTSYCTSANNNHEQKNLYLKTIVDHVNPHIFTVNEISQYEFYHNQILSEVFNTDGGNYFRKAAVTNIAGSYIINSLYYDSRKLVLHSQAVAQSYIRDINVYTLYYKHESLADGDTTFIHCVVAHLKASTGSSNEQARATMANNTMNWLKNNMSPGNFLIMGDFNLYKSAEDAYQYLVNPLPVNQAFRFFDPINRPGNWSNNSSFSDIHTQSVSSSGNGCQASGGMDDRFDFILASEKIMQGTNNVSYIPESYKALGQDGNHFNTSINSPPENTTVPADVLNALGNNSDHLPVVLKLKISTGPTGIRNRFPDITNASIQYSAEERYLDIHSRKDQIVKLSIVDLKGCVISIQQTSLSTGNNTIKLETENLAKGIYLLNIAGFKNESLTLKLIP
jgi:hypothetical protein